MDFGFSEEQELLRRQVRKLLDEHCPLEAVRRLTETADGYAPELWRQLGDLGFLGLTLPDAYGGAGLGWVDLTVLLEETGRTLFPSPLVSTTLAGSLILDAGSDIQKRRWLPRLADGSRIGAPALLDSDVLGPRGVELSALRAGTDLILNGSKRLVPDAEQADLLIVAARTGESEQDLALAVVEAAAAGVAVTGLPTLDRTKRLGRVDFRDVRVSADAVLGAPGAAWPAIERALDRGAAAVTAEMIGCAEAALAMSVQFARDRVQFGSPIGRYQGVKHPLAEMYVQIESLKSLLYYAAWALGRAPAEVPRAVSEAKAFGSLVLSRIGVDAIQLHGAVGFTEECDVQLYSKRSKWARPMFGDEDQHHDRLASLGGY
jgi:alkylation response protein AidB-like acyl-CoA dehydrogenase